jgi:hypothetical protein
MGKDKIFAPKNCGTAAYLYVMAGQLADIARSENMPVVAYLFDMAQEGAAQAGMTARPDGARISS